MNGSNFVTSPIPKGPKPFKLSWLGFLEFPGKNILLISVFKTFVNRPF